jgi:hypothetical protein
MNKSGELMYGMMTIVSDTVYNTEICQERF